LVEFDKISCLYFSIDGCIVLPFFKNESHLIGVSLTTRVGKDKKEYLTFNANDKKEVVSISLFELKSMQAIKRNHHFDKVIFSEE